ncbi:uncharacterized protein LOC132745066 [Ruditapes philippinarum]|uniref:uncharacterized protein LOC132720182 n=1 Tax=Ruditapes philippinarum TaxID=129788 RepID=UPI00295BAB15|nr:uncharacterized protein LOC132720182 [Ruditapes philippinarum]XP_060589888.1 uncharacterized protein LOC132745066 [Ruditapes philippinarum]
MKTVLALFTIIAAAAAFDCFGRNNSCANSHVKCDTGYDPFCEHFPGPMGMRVGICTCDKDCTSAADCSNTGADGCPPMAHPACDAVHHVCHCFGPHTRPPHFENESS